MADDIPSMEDALMSVIAGQLKASAGQAGSSSSVINVNAGGIGVIVAAGCCVAMLMLSGVLLWQVGKTHDSAERSAIEMRAQLREQGHQLNAIYMMAPHLKPKAPATDAVEAQP